MIRLLRRKDLHLCDPRQGSNLRSLHSSPIPKSQQQEPPNPTASFLTDSCGLPPSLALSVSKNFHLKSLTKPNAILAFLKDHGFTRTHIANLVAKQPSLLLSNPGKSIKPKLDFFLGAGYSGPDLANLFSSSPQLFKLSLDKKLSRNFFHLKSILGSFQAVCVALAKSPWLLYSNFENLVLPNVKSLRDVGVPLPNIAKLVTLFPRILTHNSDRFKKGVEAVKSLGIKPASTMFVYAMNGVCCTPSMWERKMVMYRSLGWSEEETLLAFTKHPFCMTASESKIRRAMDFYVKELRIEPRLLAARPNLLLFSFEKRIVPRCAVMKLLSSKGLSFKTTKLGFLGIVEKQFVENYVTKYRDKVPEVLDAYRGTEICRSFELLISFIFSIRSSYRSSSEISSTKFRR